MCFFLIGVSCAKRCAIILLMIILTPAWGKLTPEQHESKSKGLIFYNLDRQELAAPLLQIAAISGDSESQYYMGEIARQKSMFLSAEAQTWYEKAAEQGDIYAMIRLRSGDKMLCILLKNCGPEVKSPEEWGVVARNLAQEWFALLTPEGLGSLLGTLLTTPKEFEVEVKGITTKYNAMKAKVLQQSAIENVLASLVKNAHRGIFCQYGCENPVLLVQEHFREAVRYFDGEDSGLTHENNVYIIDRFMDAGTARRTAEVESIYKKYKEHRLVLGKAFLCQRKHKHLAVYWMG